MFELTEREYKQKLRKIEKENESYTRKQALKNAKIKRELKFPSTSKIVLFGMILLCIQIVVFVEVVMWETKNISALYALIGIPVALTPIIWSYYSKSKAENTQGGIVYESTMANINIDTTIKNKENSCG